MSAVAETRQQAVAESNTVSMFERLARDPQVDVSKLEKLMELQERAIKRSAEASYHSALAGMQAEIPSISERGEIKVGGQVRSKYALFEDINDAVRPVLQKHGFAVSFRTKIEGKTLIVTGILSHRDGHHEETSLPLPFDNSGAKNDVQQIGSSVSYGKRYVMCALLNITSRGEDDDGRAAGMPPRMSEEHQATIQAKCEEVDKLMLGRVLKHYKASALADLPDSEYETIIKRIEATAKAPAGGKK